MAHPGGQGRWFIRFGGLSTVDRSDVTERIYRIDSLGGAWPVGRGKRTVDSGRKREFCCANPSLASEVKHDPRCEPEVILRCAEEASLHQVGL